MFKTRVHFSHKRHKPVEMLSHFKKNSSFRVKVAKRFIFQTLIFFKNTLILNHQSSQTVQLSVSGKSFAERNFCLKISSTQMFLRAKTFAWISIINYQLIVILKHNSLEMFLYAKTAIANTEI
ncbi:MAG: hypothetical protein DRR16_28040 [Candidatus Parabeggiatoa sp. nov. 3]|nr:MAG: hypothetical protein DRQ99_12165 [Gammaproteobacteria bacterium]RKZ78251.1 MAG: hypothetical protein DRR16_28040 [Gammaproteobacteria bacterium]